MEHQELLKLKPDKKIEGYSFSLQSIIGQGSSGTVYLGKQDLTNTPVAIKVIDIRTLTNEYQWQLVNQEIDLMKKLQNPHIVRLLDVFQTQNNTYIITEYCNQGDLRDLLRKRKFVKEADAIKILKQILLGVYELTKHDTVILIQYFYFLLFLNCIIHRDIKPANIMINDGIMKLTDFGFARKIDDQNFMMNSLVGTPLYMSPQILKRQKYSSKCDVWSIGVILFELLTGETPWPANDMLQLINMIHNKPIQLGKIQPDLNRRKRQIFLGLGLQKPCLLAGIDIYTVLQKQILQHLFLMKLTVQWQQLVQQQKQQIQSSQNSMSSENHKPVSLNCIPQQFTNEQVINEPSQQVPVQQITYQMPIQQAKNQIIRQSPRHKTSPPFPQFLPAPPLNQQDFIVPQPRLKSTTSHSPHAVSQLSQMNTMSYNLNIFNNIYLIYCIETQSPTQIRQPLKEFKNQSPEQIYKSTDNFQEKYQSNFDKCKEGPQTPQNNKKTGEQYQKSLMKNYLRGEYLNNEKIIQNQLNFVAYLRQIRNLIEIHCRYCLDLSQGLYDKILFVLMKHASFHISLIKSEMVEKQQNILNLNEWQTFCMSETYQKCCTQVINTNMEISNILQTYLQKIDYPEDNYFHLIFDGETVNYQFFLKTSQLYLKQILRELNHKVCIRIKATQKKENMTILSRDDQLVIETLQNLLKYSSNLKQFKNDLIQYFLTINESDFLEGPFLVLDIEQYNSIRRQILQLEISQ